jgi:hypothetical protein
VAENIVQDFEISELGAVPNSPREPDDLYSPHWLCRIGIKKKACARFVIQLTHLRMACG